MKMLRREPFLRALALVFLLSLGSAACQRAAEPSAQAKNVLKWSTRWEKGHLGFDIYRSLTPDGPKEKITKKPVPSAPDAASGGLYVYEDVGIDPTRAYTYTIEVIGADGKRHHLSTIQSKPKVPKVP